MYFSAYCCALRFVDKTDIYIKQRRFVHILLLLFFTFRRRGILPAFALLCGALLLASFFALLAFALQRLLRLLRCRLFRFFPRFLARLSLLALRFALLSLFALRFIPLCGAHSAIHLRLSFLYHIAVDDVEGFVIRLLQLGDVVEVLFEQAGGVLTYHVFAVFIQHCELLRRAEGERLFPGVLGGRGGENRLPVFVLEAVTDVVYGIAVAVVVAVVSMVRGAICRSGSRYETNGVPSGRIAWFVAGLLVATLVATFAFGSAQPLVVNGKVFDDAGWLKLTDMFIGTSAVLGFVAVALVAVGVSGLSRRINSNRK